MLAGNCSNGEMKCLFNKPAYAAYKTVGGGDSLVVDKMPTVEQFCPVMVTSCVISSGFYV